MDALADSRRIEGGGTTEAVWRDWLRDHPAPVVTLDALVASDARLVVVAPHPDDEILACGALLAMHAARGGRCMVIAVTDGDASHLGSPHWTRDTLALARRSESAAGLAQLGLSDASDRFDMLRLRLPDAEVAARLPALEERLVRCLQPGDVVVTTWRLDGHPDHDATGEATARACSAAGATLLEAPVWMWHWAAPGDERAPWHRLRALAVDGDAVLRKQQALAAHVTQREPREQIGNEPLEPVLGTEILKRSLRPVEYFFVNP